MSAVGESAWENYVELVTSLNCEIFREMQGREWKVEDPLVPLLTQSEESGQELPPKQAPEPTKERFEELDPDPDPPAPSRPGKNPVQQLAGLKGGLASLQQSMDTQRQQDKNAQAIISRLVNKRRTPVREGSRAWLPANAWLLRKSSPPSEREHLP